MKKTLWLAIAVVLCYAVGWIAIGARGQSARVVKESPQQPKVTLTLRLSAHETTAGARPIQARIEMVNLGDSDFVTGNSFDPPFENDPTRLELEFQSGGKIVGCNYRLTGSWGIGTLRVPWIFIAPRHFYGDDIALDVGDYPCMDQPGHYVLTAVYHSDGGTTPSNPDWHIQASKVWQGEIRSNSAAFELLPRKRK